MRSAVIAINKDEWLQLAEQTAHTELSATIQLYLPLFLLG